MSACRLARAILGGAIIGGWLLAGSGLAVAQEIHWHGHVDLRGVHAVEHLASDDGALG